MRSANTGISAFIDKRGRIQDKSKWWEPIALRGNVSFNSEQTFYVRYGDYLGRIAAFLSPSLLLLSLVKSLNKTENTAEKKEDEKQTFSHVDTPLHLVSPLIASESSVEKKRVKATFPPAIFPLSFFPVPLSNLTRGNLVPFIHTSDRGIHRQIARSLLAKTFCEIRESLRSLGSLSLP